MILSFRNIYSCPFISCRSLIMGSLKVTGLLGGNFVGNLHVSGNIETASVDTKANIINKMFVMKWYARNIQT